MYLPDGMYGHFAGPFLGSSHDSSMLTESGLREELENLFPNEDYHIYADPAYPQSAYIFGAIRSVHGIPLTREQQQFNTSFSSVRETVEFGFKEITQQFAYTDFKATQKIYKTPRWLLLHICSIPSKFTNDIVQQSDCYDAKCCSTVTIRIYSYDQFTIT